jgi:hypothetical protein
MHPKPIAGIFTPVLPSSRRKVISKNLKEKKRKKKSKK